MNGGAAIRNRQLLGREIRTGVHKPLAVEGDTPSEPAGVGDRPRHHADVADTVRLGVAGSLIAPPDPLEPSVSLQAHNLRTGPQDDRWGLFNPPNGTFTYARASHMAAAAQAMRRILVDHARRRNAKRGANAEHVSLDAGAALCADRSDDFGALDDALNALAARAPRKAKVVELRFVGGLSVEETAEVLRISPITVMREWKSAKAWLYRELAGPTANGQ